MIHATSEDRTTTTLADAGRYEALRADDYDPMVPTERGDGESMTITMARQGRRDTEARARGEYVPTFWTRLTRTAIQTHLAQRQVATTVTIARDGVFAVTGAPAADIVAGLIDFDGDVAEHDNTVWVRSEDSRHDTPPF